MNLVWHELTPEEVVGDDSVAEQYQAAIGCFTMYVERLGGVEGSAYRWWVSYDDRNTGEPSILTDDFRYTSLRFAAESAERFANAVTRTAPFV